MSGSCAVEPLQLRVRKKEAHMVEGSVHKWVTELHSAACSEEEAIWWDAQRGQPEFGALLACLGSKKKKTVPSIRGLAFWSASYPGRFFGRVK